MASPASASSTALLAGSTSGAPSGRASGQPPGLFWAQLRLWGRQGRWWRELQRWEGRPRQAPRQQQQGQLQQHRLRRRRQELELYRRHLVLCSSPGLRRALALVLQPVDRDDRHVSRSAAVRRPCSGRQPCWCCCTPRAGAGRPAARHAGSAAGHAGALHLGRAAPLLRRRPAAVLLRVGPSTAGPSTWIGQPHHRPSIVLGSAVSYVDFQHHDAAAATSY